MIGRAAIQHPWIFAEARAALAGRPPPPPPPHHEPVRVYRTLLTPTLRARGERWGVQVTRRHIPLLGPRLSAALRAPLCASSTVAGTLALLELGSRSPDAS
jgi:tRNA-dihydrouridine synthase